MSTSLAKSRPHLKMCNIHIGEEDHPNHIPTPPPKKKKKKSSTEKQKKLLDDEIQQQNSSTPNDYLLKREILMKEKTFSFFQLLFGIVELIIRNIYVFCRQCTKFSDGVYNYDILKRDNALKVHFFYITLLSRVILYLCNRIQCLLY